MFGVDIFVRVSKPCGSHVATKDAAVMVNKYNQIYFSFSYVYLAAAFSETIGVANKKK